MAFTTEQSTCNQLALSWGVETFVVPHVNNTDDMVAQVDASMTRLKRYQEGDTVIVTAGTPPGVPGTTNMVRVHHLGTLER
jgi:pyruvate kinase